MRFSKYSVTNNDGNLVSGKNEFYESTCLGDSVSDIVENE